MDSTLSSASLPAAATTPRTDGCENDVRRRRANTPLSSLSGTPTTTTRPSSSCNDTPVPPRPESSPSQPSQPSEEDEPEVVLPATTTSLSNRKSLFVLRPIHRYVDIVCICLSVLAYLLETTLNAALAIFGIGVGVGLVLGDSFRAALPMLPSAQSQQQPQQQQQGNAMTTAAAMAESFAAAPRSVSDLLPAQ